MADDRLDDAIAAVTRAVGRIEAATRGASVDPYAGAPDLPLPPQPRMPPPPAFTPEFPSFSSESTGFAARPTTAPGGVPQHHVEPQVDPSWSDYELPGPPEAPYLSPGPAYAPDENFQPDPQLDPQFTPEAHFQPQQPFHPEPSFQPEAFQDLAPPPLPELPIDAPTEVHELVGRIVARTQALEEHLDAARTLRAEIAALVGRLAAAAERDH